MGISVYPAPGGGLQPKQQVFTTDGVWTKPSGVKSVTVTLVGCGGNARSFSVGGGGGGVLKDIVIDVSGVTSVPVYVGQTGSQRGSAFGQFAVAGSGSGAINAALGGFSGASIQYDGVELPIGVTPSNSNIRQIGTNGASFSAPIGGDGKAFIIPSAIADRYDYAPHPFEGTSNSFGTSVTGSSFSGSTSIAYGTGAYGDGRFILMPHDAGNTVNYFVSTTGQPNSWTAQAFPVNFSTMPGGARLQYANGIFMFVGRNNTNLIVYTSTTGLAGSWTKVYDAAFPSGLMTMPSNVFKYSGGRWIVFTHAATTNAGAWSTNNGASWTTFSLPASSGGYNDIGFVNGRWCIADFNTTNYRYSSDLINWTTISNPSGLGANLASVLEGRKGVYLASTNSAYLGYSTDGINFTNLNQNGTNYSASARYVGRSIDGYMFVNASNGSSGGPQFLDGGFGVATPASNIGGASAGEVQNNISAAGIITRTGIDGLGVGGSIDGNGYANFGSGAAANTNGRGSGGICIVRWFE